MRDVAGLKRTAFPENKNAHLSCVSLLLKGNIALSGIQQWSSRILLEC